MPSVIRRIEKHRSRLLPDGEAIVAATVSNPAGALGAGMRNNSARLVRHYQDAQGRLIEGTLAARMPAKPLYLVLTPSRLAVFTASGAFGTKPADLVAQYAPTDINAVEWEQRSMTWAVWIAFSDGSRQDLELHKAAQPTEFLTALNSWRAAGSGFQ